jgi:hypothetical protein
MFIYMVTQGSTPVIHSPTPSGPVVEKMFWK